MQKFKFIHAADLHLDVPMQKLSANLALGAEASFIALDNLVELALKKNVDALVLAGDIWNEEDASLRARLKFKKACDILNEHNVAVYLAHGNHDPLTKLFQSIQYPKNVHLFTEKYKSFAFEKNNEILAYIHGISHANKEEKANLSKLFEVHSKASKDEYFHINILHTSLTGSEKEDKYAPCSVADLREKNPHYWALGHIHTFQIIDENPFIAFTGSLQGAHINEEGAHGCLYVELQRDVESKHVEIIKEFIPLAPLYWKKIQYTIEEDIEDLISLQERIQDYLLEKKEEILNSSHENLRLCTKQIVLRLKLDGKTVLNYELHDIYKLKEFHAILNEELQLAHPPIFIQDIDIETKNAEKEKSIEELLLADNFLSEVLKKGEKLYEVSEEELMKEMEKIYKESPILKGHFKLLPMPRDKDFYTKIIRQAQYLSSQLLEKSE